jgi:predicted dehydrogenase
MIKDKMMEAKMTTDNSMFRAAIIGLGFIGAGDPVSGDAIGQKVSDLEGTHAQALAAHPQVQLVTGASRDEGRRTRFEKRTGIDKTYADWRELLAAEKLDIVSVATNSPYHAEITAACAEAGVRAVFCEKPIATRLSDADRALRACREHGTLLAVNHQRRWHPLWRTVADEIRAGVIGDVYHVVVHWPTGRLGNVGTHWFDALGMLLGAEAQAVSGTFDPVVHPDCRGSEYCDPGGWGIVAFSGGIKAFIHGPQEAEFPLVLRVAGSLGQLTLRGNCASVELWSGDKRSIAAPSGGPNAIELAVQDIVKCLATGGTPADTGEDALAALEIIIGFHVSDRLRGQWVPLPIGGADRDLEVRIG